MPAPSWQKRGGASRGEAASGVEFVLEGLHLTRRMSKATTGDGRTLYGSREAQ